MLPATLRLNMNKSAAVAEGRNSCTDAQCDSLHGHGGGGGSAGIAVPDVLLVIIAVLAIILNGLLLVVMYNGRKTMFKTRTAYLVTNVCLADFLTGLALLLTMVMHLAKYRLLSNYWFFLLSTSIQVSFITLIHMSIDRLIVTVCPMSWSTILTTSRTTTILWLTWVTAIFTGILLVHTVHRRRLAMLMFWEISIILIIAIHFFIIIFLRRQQQRYSSAGSSAAPSTLVPPPPCTMDVTLQATHRKVTSVVLTLVSVLCITYIPYIVSSNILMAHTQGSMKIRIHDELVRYTQAWSYVNYVANPIAYCWRLRIYRRALYRLLTQCLAGGNPPVQQHVLLSVLQEMRAAPHQMTTLLEEVQGAFQGAPSSPEVAETRL